MGEIEWGVEWQGTDPDYVAELGLTDQHVPALVAIARGQTELEDFPGAQPVLLALRYCLIVFMQRRASVVF
jgi:hypothetical protein